ncbi:MAG: hypothetical protein AB1941_29020, partial [Gemmatimonadota bacterium]
PGVPIFLKKRDLILLNDFDCGSDSGEWAREALLGGGSPWPQGPAAVFFRLFHFFQFFCLPICIPFGIQDAD